MKIDAGTVLKNLKGEPFKLTEDTKLTLGDVIAEAVATDTTAGKFKLYSLAVKASEGKEFDVDAADLKLIKTALENCKSYGTQNTIIVGQAIGLLEEVK